jgi:hypothetical protein
MNSALRQSELVSRMPSFDSRLPPLGCLCPRSHLLRLRALCGDVLVHHAIALGLHTTVLVLLKAALNGRSSKLMPDKGSFWMVRELRELKLQLPAMVKLAAAVSGGSR